MLSGGKSMANDVENRIDRLNEYKHKCDVLKQINSNKSLYYKRINTFQSLLTVIVSGIITFLGFSGNQKIATYVLLLFHTKVSETTIEALYNISVFVLFLVTICHLLFHTGEKQADSDKAIWILSNLMNEINDACSDNSITITEDYVKTICARYDTITQSIPANTDKEYKKAKETLIKKAARNRPHLYTVPGVYESDKNKEDFCLKIFNESPEIQRILSILCQAGPQYYLGGGVLRNLVWDRVSGYGPECKTPIEDVDVVYFNGDDTSEDTDIQIEEQFRKISPNYMWDVKNQARMHQKSGDEPYDSLEDAISKWPETASAIAIKKDCFGKYHIIAPYKYDDLLRLLIKPTPSFANKKEKFHDRISQKNWRSHWTRLEVIYD